MNPVVLFGSTSFSFSGLGGPAVGVFALNDEIALKNWTDRPLRVRDLRFQLYDSDGYDLYASFNTARDPGAGGEVELRIGNEPITYGFVPILGATWPRDSGAPAGVAPGVVSLTFTKPVVLLPGERIGLRVQFPGAVFQVAPPATLEVYATCVPAALAGKSYYPVIASYSAVDRAAAAAGIYTETSGPAVFRNDFAASILVDRFVGWFYKRYMAAANRQVQDVTADLLRVRMEDHLGNQIIRERTPFALAFDQPRRYWRVNALLPSKGFFRLTLDSDLRAPAVGIANVPTPVVTMLAYRPR